MGGALPRIAGTPRELPVDLRDRAQNRTDGIADRDVGRRVATDQQHRKAHLRHGGCRSSGELDEAVPQLQHVLQRGAAEQVAELSGAEFAPFAEADDDRARRQPQRLLHRGGLAQNHRDGTEFTGVEAER